MSKPRGLLKPAVKAPALELTKSTPIPRIVLIVESEPILKLCIAGLVETAGFIVLEASNADEAICALEHRADIGLVVTNVVMPGTLDGVGLAYAVDQRWPSVKVIVVSGKSGLSESDLPIKSLFIVKPYHEEELIFEIRAYIGP